MQARVRGQLQPVDKLLVERSFSSLSPGCSGQKETCTQSHRGLGVSQATCPHPGPCPPAGQAVAGHPPLH